MTVELVGVEVDAVDPERLAQFWSALLSRTLIDATTIADGGSGFRTKFVPRSDPKTSQNRIHFDLTSTSDHEQRALVERAIKLGGRPVDIGQRDDEPHVVMGDPEGNEFCVIEPGNRFLTGTDLIGAVNCDGTQALGYFWSSALEWPLVWDEDQETAIQSPRGGSKVTWSGPPLMPRSGRDRLRLMVSPASGDVRTEVQRLVALGAAEVDHDKAGARTDASAALVDPDGNAFVLTPRLDQA